MDKPSIIEQLQLNITTPRGYVCSNEQDLLVISREIALYTWICMHLLCYYSTDIET